MEVGICNNCWARTKPQWDGSCPKCGCYVFIARRTKIKHGVMEVCHKMRCPRRKQREDSK